MSDQDSILASFFTLRGPTALSPFRLEKLLQPLRENFPVIRSINAEFVHFVQVAEALSKDEMAILEALVTYGSPAINAPTGSPVLVLPRIGTLSSWASKATDIAHNCGLKNVKRIERGIAFYVEADGELAKDARAAILHAIHDPMTETVRFSLDDARELFVTLAPAPLTSVATTRDGKAALARANADMGLALSDEEVDYLFDYFASIKRDPTDVELMMFAQANSDRKSVV